MAQSLGGVLSSLGGDSSGFGQLGGMGNQVFGNSYRDFGPWGTPGPGAGTPMGALGSENQDFPLTPGFGGMADVGLGPTINNLGWTAARNESLATQQLMEYESGDLPTGTKAAIEQAFTEGENTLTSEYAAMGRNPAADTSFGEGMTNLQQEKSIATQAALQQLLDNYMNTSALELNIQATQGQLEVQQGQLAIAQEQIALQEQQMQMQKDAQDQSALGGAMQSLMSGLGSLFGGL